MAEVWTDQLLGQGPLSSIIKSSHPLLPILIVLYVWIPIGLNGPYIIFTSMKMLVTGKDSSTHVDKEKERNAQT